MAVHHKLMHYPNVLWAASILGLVLYIYAIWRIVHTWAGRSQFNLVSWWLMLGLIGGFSMGLLYMARIRH
jgi:hypothetical protein